MLCQVKSQILKVLRIDIADDRCQRAPQSHVIFLLEELIIHLKLCGSQANLQQFHNGFGLQGRPFRESVIFMEFIADDFQGFIN
jgi:hypothetical protein